MTKSVNLYLVSGVFKGVGFWLINFTEEHDIYYSLGSKFLECYRKELFGLEAAIEVKKAINTTLDILSSESKFDRYKLDICNTAYSSEIPINLIEDIFDLWVCNYNNDIKWKKYIGLLNLRRKIKKRNNFIYKGLKGETLEFAFKLEQLLDFRPVYLTFKKNQSNHSMW